MNKSVREQLQNLLKLKGDTEASYSSREGTLFIKPVSPN